MKTDQESVDQVEEEDIEEEEDDNSDEDHQAESDEEENSDDETQAESRAKVITTSYGLADPNKPPPPPHTPQKLREFFVKYEGLSYWHCEWVSEAVIEVFHKILYRIYTNRNDMTIPPSSDALREEAEGDGDGEVEVDPEMEQKYYDPKLEKTFYRNGVKPTYLQIHRVLNYKQTKRGDEWYLIKWRDLGYEASTWEMEGGDVAKQIRDWKSQTDFYWNHKKYMEESEERVAAAERRAKQAAKGKKSGKGSRESAAAEAEPPKRDPKEKFVDQPWYTAKTGGNLHPYQLEGLNWLRFSWSQHTDVILADEMVSLSRFLLVINLFVIIESNKHFYPVA
jgi:chromodomain-helicase-DNA-binding protein 4